MSSSGRGGGSSPDAARYSAEAVIDGRLGVSARGTVVSTGALSARAELEVTDGVATGRVAGTSLPAAGNERSITCRSGRWTASSGAGAPVGSGAFSVFGGGSRRGAAGTGAAIGGSVVRAPTRVPTTMRTITG